MLVKILSIFVAFLENMNFNYHNKIHIPTYRYLIQSLDRSYRDTIGDVDAVTPFMKMFRGSMVQHIICTNCSNVSTSLQPFNDIGLDIDHVRTLNDAINLYFMAKRLDEGSKKTNVYKCTACQRNVEAKQKFSISELPPVLCLQLKRFGKNQKLHD